MLVDANVVTEVDEKSQIEALLDAYNESLNLGDSELAMAVFEYPLAIWQDGVGHMLEDEEEFEEYIETVFDTLLDDGITSTKITNRSIIATNNSAIAVVEWEQINQADEKHNFISEYMLVKLDGMWRITAIINEANG